MENTKKCIACGHEMIKGSTHSEETWAKMMYCSYRCKGRASRLNARGYLGWYLVTNDIPIKEFHQALSIYAEGISMFMIAKMGDLGIGYRGGHSLPAEEIAIRVGCALHDLTPEMRFWTYDGELYDYRMLLQDVGSIDWFDFLPANQTRNTAIWTAIDQSGMTKEEFLNKCRDHVQEYNRMTRRGLVPPEAVRRIFTYTRTLDQDAKNTGNEVIKEVVTPLWYTYAEMLIRKKYEMTAKSAFALSQILAIYGTNIDYRMLLPAYGPDDYLTNRTKKKKRMQ